ncbi:10015_t:CDS:2, partial [Gigaspora rosea]
CPLPHFQKHDQEYFPYIEIGNGRKAPKIVQSYLLDFPVATARAKIREEFEKNRYVSDLKVIDVLIFKGRAEYQETLNSWKMDTHIMRYFSKEESPPKPEGFLEKFYGIEF